MKTYTLILILSLMASVCGAHDDWLSGSTDRQHLSGADLNNYLHGHKETVNGTVRTGYWDYNPDVDNAWEKTKANWEASGCITKAGLYDKDCYNKWIKQGNLEPTENQTPTNSPTQHSGCYGSGAEHFHRLDGNNYGHGLDHSGHVFVSGVLSGIHRHPACKNPCADCGEKNLPDDPFENTEDEGEDPSALTSDNGIRGISGETIAPATTLENILRITYLSFEEVSGRGRIRTYKVLTLQLTAYAPNTTHNGLVIVVNGQHYPTPYQFFGQTLLSTNDRRTVSLKAYPRNDAVYLKTNGNSAWHNGDWQAIDTFDIQSFTVSIRDSGATTDRDIVRHTDIDADGNRIGSVGGAPSLSKPKLVTVWAALKRQ